MLKKPSTARLDDRVLEVAQRLATAERRSVISLIEIAVLEYERRRRAAPDIEMSAAKPPPTASILPAIAAFYREGGGEPSSIEQVEEHVAAAVCGALGAMDMFDAEVMPAPVCAAFGGLEYIKSAFGWHRALAAWRQKRGRNKGGAPSAPALPS
jgi:hypothetical protein